MANPKTVLDCINLATNHLQQSGVENPRLDAEVLLGDVLNLERIQLYVQYDRPLVSHEVKAYRSHIARRARREPVAYIVGEREFYSLPLKVDSRVLIPRPETELIIDEVAQQLSVAFPKEGAFKVADIGTGSGAIAIGLTRKEPSVSVIATDIDEGALDVARENAAMHGLASHIEFRCGDLLEPIAGERFHAIVSNPPYVSQAEWMTLQPDVKSFEPKRALVGGEDGLAIIRRLIAGAGGIILPGGFVAIEIGAGQGSAVKALAHDAGFSECRIVQDLAGLDRIAVMT